MCAVEQLTSRRMETMTYISALNTVPRFIQVRQIGHFYKADPDYGIRVDHGLAINIHEIIGKVA